MTISSKASASPSLTKEDARIFYSAIRHALLQERSGYRLVPHRMKQNCHRLIMALRPSKRQGIIGIYAATRGECDPFPIGAFLRRQGWQLALPIIQNKHTALLFRHYAPAINTQKGRYDIQTPPLFMKHVLPDILLVPLLAFDKDGYRLGYGGGYYDRTIHHYRQNRHRCLTIGIAFDEQYATTIPHDDKDERLDAIVTPHATIMTSRRGT